LLAHTYSQRVSNGAPIHSRPIVTFDEQGHAPSVFQMARPGQRIIESGKFFEQQLRFFDWRYIRRSFGPLKTR